MKKILSILLAIMLVFEVCGCDKKDTSKEINDVNSSADEMRNRHFDISSFTFYHGMNSICMKNFITIEEFNTNKENQDDIDMQKDSYFLYDDTKEEYIGTLMLTAQRDGYLSAFSISINDAYTECSDLYKYKNSVTYEQSETKKEYIISERVNNILKEAINLVCEEELPENLIYKTSFESYPQELGFSEWENMIFYSKCDEKDNGIYLTVHKK